MVDMLAYWMAILMGILKGQKLADLMVTQMEHTKAVQWGTKKVGMMVVPTDS